MGRRRRRRRRRRERKALCGWGCRCIEKERFDRWLTRQEKREKGILYSEIILVLGRRKLILSHDVGREGEYWELLLLLRVERVFWQVFIHKRGEHFIQSIIKATNQSPT